jgi:hypothetical protein
MSILIMGYFAEVELFNLAEDPSALVRSCLQ